MTRSAVEQIKERLSIVDVVGMYVELIRAGKNFKAKSPFTNEKTPSFYVAPDRGMYYCFSSQKGGDMFTFVQEMEGVDFKGALKILAEKAQVELTAENPQKRDARDMQYALLEEATRFFFEAREKHPEINEYIMGRGVKVATIHAWRIGYAPDAWRDLKHHLTKKGFTEANMLSAGLIKNADAGKESYDVFRDRIMFPICDPSGRVVAFSGRTMKKEDGIPKYVNSPETELFQKSEILYGYDKAKQSIRTLDFSLVVEGQFDVVLSHQAGYTNTVAVSGTALTPHHAMLLTRLSQNVVLALDADRAGVSAIKRTSPMLLKHGMNVKVAQLPEGKDPADVVRDNPQALKEIVGQSVHVVEFLLTVLKRHYDDDRAYKLHVREEVLPLLVAIENRIDREHFEGVVAETIGATKDGVHYEVERTAERLAEPLHATPAVAVGTTAEHQGKRTSLEAHLRAMYEVLSHTHPWIPKEMEYMVVGIVGDNEADAFWRNSSRLEQARVFEFEHHIESMREKDIIAEVEHVVTHYAHTVAREKLRTLKAELKNAEEKGDMDRVIDILAQAKHAERLLQSSLTLTQEST
ncbi:MAG TPA: DNA primase [Candidatus Paceibacterota bacterium]|nr:DNA primase [Candidatus Paceibacterota bacterium]